MQQCKDQDFIAFQDKDFFLLYFQTGNYWKMIVLLDVPPSFSVEEPAGK